MFDSKHLDELSKRFSQSLPSSLKEAKQDIEKNFKLFLQGTFSKLDLVSREEFDAQAKVLSRTREKLEALEKQLDFLMKEKNDNDHQPMD